MQATSIQRETTLEISINKERLVADLFLPTSACGLVIFAHGAGSNRFSPRNRFVAAELNASNLGTLLLDLLTEEEGQEKRQVNVVTFDISLLASRLVAVTDWILTQQHLAELPLAYFGSDTGAAAALIAASNRQTSISAIVSRGGRPDLARNVLSSVRTPTLFIVGGHDHLGLDLNRKAIAEMPEPSQSALEIVPGATHLFEEPGALEKVADVACEWLWQHCGCGRCGEG